MTEEELEQRRNELQEQFKAEREYQKIKSGYELYKKEKVKKPLKQIQREFDIDILGDKEYEKVNTDLSNIKRVLIAQDKDIEYLMEEQNRLLRLLFAKEKEIIKMKRVILQQQERVDEYENELMNLQKTI